MPPPARRALVALAGAIALGSWLPALLSHARDVDVLLYMAAAARADAAGALPYVSAWIEKGPLAMGLFQGLAALAGPFNLAAVALAWLALALAMVWLAARLATALGGGGVWAAALLAVALPAVGGSLNTEVPAAVAVTASLLVWLRSRRGGRAGLGLAAGAGLLAGAAFLCRQNAGLLGPLLLLADAAAPALAGAPWRFRLGRAAALGAGWALLPAATVALYAAAGHLETFLFCFHGYNTGIYVAATRWSAARILAAPVTGFWNFLWPVPTAAALGGLGLALAAAGAGGGSPAGADAAEMRARRRGVALAAAGLTASLFLGLRFFSHYFALALPLWAALGGWAAHRALSVTRSRRAVAVLAAVILLSLGGELARRPWRDTLVRLRDWSAAGGLSRLGDPLAWPRRDGLATAAARYIREHSSPDDRVFVWGMRPHVPIYARRLPATRFVTSTFLAGVVPWERMTPADGTAGWIVPGSWDLLQADLEEERPLFIVDASQDHLFGDGSHPPGSYPVLAAILARDYRRVAAWGEVDRLVLWRRRDRPDPTSGYPAATP